LQSPVRAWLEQQCQMISGAEGGLVLLGGSEDGSADEVTQWPPGERSSRPLLAAVEAARDRGKLFVKAPAADCEADPGATQVAVPLLESGLVIGAAGVSVRGIAAPEIQSLAGLLAYGTIGLSQLLQVGAQGEQLAERIALAGDLLDHEHLAEAAHALAVRVEQQLGCERAALGLVQKSEVRVLGLSTGLRFAEETDAVARFADAMEEAIDQDALVSWPAPPDAGLYALGAHERLARELRAAAVCSVPLAAHGRAVGALTCAFSTAEAVDPAVREHVREASLLAGPILDLLAQAEAGALERARKSARAWIERRIGDRHVARWALAGLVGLLVLLAVVPGSYRVSARARIEGRVQRALVAGVAGYVSEATARAGDLVRQGDVIARLDDRDLVLERGKRASEMAQLQQEYRGALAARERTKVSILKAKIDQANARLRLAEEQLERTAIVAPFDGIILEGDLDRSLGSPVELGSVLFELAPLEGYRIIIEVDGRDIGDVAVDQGGKLALEALPGRTLPLHVERVTPISTSENGRSYFRIEAALEQPLAELRPGMEGIAKIDVGTRRLLWIWTHEMFDWLRLVTWTFLP
jgi:multidrug resistance efflux pump